uniref:Uncharacterized protein n=1 Tax=Acrobeloides nanus TaxID=290746 RepID=A0A914CR08_9BILA
MKQLLGVLVVGVLAAIVMTQTTSSPDLNCRTCFQIIGYADYLIWQSGQNWTESQLEGELEHECVRISGRDGVQIYRLRKIQNKFAMI